MKGSHIAMDVNLESMKAYPSGKEIHPKASKARLEP